MGFEVLAALTAKALRDPRHSSVEFIWHGGEPTLLPLQFFEKALLLQYRFRTEGHVVRNSIQTNGTLTSQEWIDFLRANAFRVGLSLDGPRHVHDRHRRTAGGEATFDRVLETVGALRGHGIPFGVTMVVDQDTLDDGATEVFETFAELGIGDYGVIGVKPDNPPASSAEGQGSYASPSRMSSFLIELYDIWRRRGDPGIRIRELESLRHRILQGTTSFCTLSGSCFGRYYAVEPDGTTSHCDLFLGDEDYTVGNIKTQDFSDFDLALQPVRDADAKDRRSMAACKNFDVCQGWCPHERYLARWYGAEGEQNCCGLNDLIDHIRCSLGREDLGRDDTPPVLTP